MKLSMEQLKSIYFGALYFRETEEGYLQSFQYSQEQMNYFEEVSEFWFERSFASSAKTLEFSTEATALSFQYQIIWAGSDDSFEMAVNGLIDKIFYVKDIEKKGCLSFELPEGKKDIILYLPADATVLLRNFEVNGDIVPAKKGEKVLWMGDSITQGYGPLRSAQTYVSVANRLLNYDILNQGIGGYVYDKNVLLKMGDYVPDKIIISMGTNQFVTESMKDVEEYYERLKEVYRDIPVLCITPLWRGDVPDGEPILKRFCENIKMICKKYSNIITIEGFKLIPHLSEYFLDDLHPNELGCEVYGRNLVSEIRKLGF